MRQSLDVNGRGQTNGRGTGHATLGIRAVLKVVLHALAIVAIYLVFSFAMFLGLQVRPLYGNIGLLVAFVLVAAYVYFGFVRKAR